MSSQRQPAGVPTGGQFAPTGRAEADLELDPIDQVDVASSCLQRAVLLGPVSDENQQPFGVIIGDNGSAALLGTLLDPNEPEHSPYNSAMHGIESMILAHAAAGVDVQSPQYQEGIETAVFSAADNLPDHDTGGIYRAIDGDGPQIQTAAQPMPQTFHGSDHLADYLNDSIEDERDGWCGIEGAWGCGYGVAVGFNEPVDNPADAVAYYMHGPMGMGSDGFDKTTAEPVEPGPDGKARVWKFTSDFTKSPRDDVGMAMDDFETTVRAGSPVRKTNRAGDGTAGTRAVEGVGDIDVFVAIRG